MRNIKQFIFEVYFRAMGRRSTRPDTGVGLVGNPDAIRRCIQQGEIQEEETPNGEWSRGNPKESRTVSPKFCTLAKSPFMSNRVTNSKYTILTFLPLNMYEQFGRFINQYFLLIACLQLIRTLTPVSPVTTWTPLIIIFLISALKEGLDDYRRHQADDQWNNKEYIIAGTTFSTRNELIAHGIQARKVKCKDIQVGDVIYLEEGAEIPCDAVVVHSSEVSTLCGAFFF